MGSWGKTGGSYFRYIQQKLNGQLGLIFRTYLLASLFHFLLLTSENTLAISDRTLVLQKELFGFNIYFVNPDHNKELRIRPLDIPIHNFSSLSISRHFIGYPCIALIGQVSLLYLISCNSPENRNHLSKEIQTTASVQSRISASLAVGE